MEDYNHTFDPRVPFATTLASVVTRRREAQRHPDRYVRVVCELDGSPAAGRALRAAIDFCRQQGASLELVPAAQPVGAVFGPAPVEATALLLASALSIARERGVTAQVMQPQTRSSLEPRPASQHSRKQSTLSATPERLDRHAGERQ